MGKTSETLDRHPSDIYNIFGDFKPVYQSINDGAALPVLIAACVVGYDRNPIEDSWDEHLLNLANHVSFHYYGLTAKQLYQQRRAQEAAKGDKANG